MSSNVEYCTFFVLFIHPQITMIPLSVDIEEDNNPNKFTFHITKSSADFSSTVFSSILCANQISKISKPDHATCII